MEVTRCLASHLTGLQEKYGPLGGQLRGQNWCLQVRMIKLQKHVAYLGKPYSQDNSREFIQ
eukprot:c48024_g1_i1 orf=39-221(+)